MIWSTAVALVVLLLATLSWSTLGDSGLARDLPPPPPPAPAASARNGHGTVAPTGSPSAAAPPGTATATAVPPDDAQTVAAVEEFMTNLRQHYYNLAWSQLCADGQARFASGTALRTELGLGARSVTSYSLGKITSVDFNGDPRKALPVRMVLTDGPTRMLDVSVTIENDAVKICGF